MEKKTPAPNQPEQRKFSTDPVLIILGIVLASIAPIDFSIHWNGAISDPEMREFFRQYIGEFVNHVGNFGLAAAMTIPIVFGKKFLEHSDTLPEDITLYDKALELGYKATMVGIFTIPMLVEGFKGNYDFWPDTLTSFGGIIAAKGATEGALRKFRLGRESQVKNKADGHHFLENIPVSTDEIFPS